MYSTYSKIIPVHKIRIFAKKQLKKPLLKYKINLKIGRLN